MGYDTDVARALRPPSKAPWLLVGLLLAGAVGGGYHFYTELQKAKGETSAATAKASADVAAATAAQKDLTDKVEKLEGEKAELTNAKEELSKEVAAKSGELEQLEGTYDKLQAQMKDEIAHGDISLSEDGGRLRVGLVDKILFDSGEAAISKRGEEVLAKVGAVLASIDDKQIQVSGHTDRTPISDKLTVQFPTNWELSTARAINVVRFLSEKANVPPERLVASGYSEYHPIANNKTAAGRAKNRRIEILLTPSLAPKKLDKGKLTAVAEKEKPAEPEPKLKAKEKSKK
ncbi:MAG TPA: flagellar motor protein MotB [Polyangia bacterium]|jgi:chemotaxis protein MotB